MSSRRATARTAVHPVVERGVEERFVGGGETAAKDREQTRSLVAGQPRPVGRQQVAPRARVAFALGGQVGVPVGAAAGPPGLRVVRTHGHRRVRGRRSCRGNVRRCAVPRRMVPRCAVPRRPVPRHSRRAGRLLQRSINDPLPVGPLLGEPPAADAEHGGDRRPERNGADRRVQQVGQQRGRGHVPGVARGREQVGQQLLVAGGEPRCQLRAAELPQRPLCAG